MLVFKARRKSPVGVSALTSSEQRVTKIILNAMREARAEMPLNSLIQLVSGAPVDKILRSLPTEPWLKAQVLLRDEFLAEVLDAGSRVKLPAIKKAAQNFVFNRENLAAARWADQNAGKLIVEITQSQRDVVAGLVYGSQVGNYTPAQLAREIRGRVGLTTAQAGWVENKYQWALNSNLSIGMPFDAAERAAASLADRYQDTVHRYRSETIARTEIMRANSEGRREAWNQGLQEGFISPTLMQEWDATNDPCDDCQALAGEQIPITAEWADGSPPLHPNCRCDLILVDTIDPEVAALNEEELDALINDLLQDTDVTGEDILDVVDNPDLMTPEVSDVIDVIEQEVVTPDEALWRAADRDAREKAVLESFDRVVEPAERAGVTISDKQIINMGDDKFRIRYKGDSNNFVMTRTVEYNGLEGSVSHDLFTLPKELQGKGIATEMITNMEKEYLANGITSIEVHANIDVGGYTWSRMGFDWDPNMMDDNLLMMTRTLRVMENYLEDSALTEDVKALLQGQLNGWSDRIQSFNPIDGTNFDSLPLPVELSSFGTDYGVEIGKKSMLKTDWFGKKMLK